MAQVARCMANLFHRVYGVVSCTFVNVSSKMTYLLIWGALHTLKERGMRRRWRSGELSNLQRLTRTQKIVIGEDVLQCLETIMDREIKREEEEAGRHCEQNSATNHRVQQFLLKKAHITDYHSTGLRKRNGAKLRESFCLTAASHSRPCQARA